MEWVQVGSGVLDRLPNLTRQPYLTHLEGATDCILRNTSQLLTSKLRIHQPSWHNSKIFQLSLSTKSTNISTSWVISMPSYTPVPCSICLVTLSSTEGWRRSTKETRRKVTATPTISLIQSCRKEAPWNHCNRCLSSIWMLLAALSKVNFSFINITRTYELKN